MKAWLDCCRCWYTWRMTTVDWNKRVDKTDSQRRSFNESSTQADNNFSNHQSCLSSQKATATQQLWNKCKLHTLPDIHIFPSIKHHCFVFLNSTRIQGAIIIISFFFLSHRPFYNRRNANETLRFIDRYCMLMYIIVVLSRCVVFMSAWEF